MTTAWSTENLVTLPTIIDGDMMLLDRQAIEWFGQQITPFRARVMVTPDGDLITERGVRYTKPTPNNSKIWR